MSEDACAAMAAVADAIETSDPREFLVELGARVAGIPRGRTALLGLLVGGRTRLPGGGFRPDLRDHTAGQTRHFAGTARAVTVFGARRTEWLSVHARRDAPTSPDGRLSALAVEFATALLEGRLTTDRAGAWIRANVCD